MTRAVLTFHSLDQSGGVLSFEPRRFAELVESLQRNRVPILTYHELLAREHGVTITFDDGMRSVHEHALPVLRAHRAPAHLFLTTGIVGGDNRWPSQPRHAPTLAMLNWNQIEDCAHGGITIESHTHSHPDLRRLDQAQIDAECDAGDAAIERHVGRRPRLFAYPYGAFDARVAAAAGARYEACFSTNMAFIGRDNDRLQVPRIEAYYLRGAWPGGRLLGPAAQAYLTGRGSIRRLRGIR